MQELKGTSGSKFDFYGKEEEAQRITSEKLKKESFIQFKKMGMVGVSILTATAVLTGASYSVYSNYQHKIDEKITNVENNIRSTPKDKIVQLMEKERDTVKKVYAQNQLLINNYSGYKDLIKVLALEHNVGIKDAQNSKLRQSSLQSIDNDSTSIDKIQVALDSNRDKKIALFLEGNDILTYNNWINAVKNNQFLYVGGLIHLNKDIQGELDYLKQTQDEVIKSVQEKIKSKDYNLDAAQSAIVSKVTADANSEVADLKKIRSEIAGTENDNLLTDKDVTEAQDAMTDLQHAALIKIGEDRSAVEAMIAKASKDDKQTSNALTSNTLTGQNTGVAAPQVIHSGGGMTFMDYYLLNHWLSSSSSSNYNSGYSQGYNAGATNAAVAANSAGHVSPNAALAKSSSNLYDIKKPDSYLNKGLSNMPAKDAMHIGSLDKARSFSANKPDISALRAKINMARSKGIQADNMRISQIARADAARAATARAATARATSFSSARGVSVGGG